MKIYIGILVLFLFSCQSQQSENQTPSIDSSQTVILEKIPLDTPQLEEVFIDSTAIGMKA